MSWKMVLGQSIALALMGVVLGLAGCIEATRVLSTFLFGIKATDPFTLGGVAIFLVAAAAVASYIPRGAVPPSTLLLLSERSNKLEASSSGEMQYSRRLHDCGLGGAADKCFVQRREQDQTS